MTCSWFCYNFKTGDDFVTKLYVIHSACHNEKLVRRRNRTRYDSPLSLKTTCRSMSAFYFVFLDLLESELLDLVKTKIFS